MRKGRASVERNEVVFQFCGVVYSGAQANVKEDVILRIDQGCKSKESDVSRESHIAGRYESISVVHFGILMRELALQISALYICWLLPYDPTYPV